MAQAEAGSSGHEQIATLLGPSGADPQKEKLVLEGTNGTLPTHSPLLTRWLKVYLVVDFRSKAILRVIITIRGNRQE